MRCLLQNGGRKLVLQLERRAEHYWGLCRDFFMATRSPILSVPELVHLSRACLRLFLYLKMQQDSLILCHVPKKHLIRM